MSEEQSFSRLQKRGIRREIQAHDVGRVEALVERLRRTGKGRRGAERSSTGLSVDLKLRTAQHKRGRPIGD